MGRWITGVLSLVAVLVVAKGYAGWHDARKDAPALLQEAAVLITSGRGGADLGAGRLELLLAVQDPNFFKHNGVDFMTPGTGMMTVTQALADRLAIASFAPGAHVVRQVTYALALDERLPKLAQIALFLDRVEMGQGPDGQWVTGFFNAAEAVYQRPAADLTDEEYLTLVAVMLAPSELPMAAPNETLTTRVARLAALVEGRCSPHGPTDVWLDGCA